MKTAIKFFPEWALDNTNSLPSESFKFAEDYAKLKVEEALKEQAKAVDTAMGMFKLGKITELAEQSLDR